LKIKLLEVEPAQPGGKPRRIKISIWDTAGQERFRTLTSSYYRGAQGVVLVYDVTRRETFDNLEHWCKEIDMNTGSTGETGVVKILVGNKIDAPAEARQVSKREGEQWAREHGMLFIETSAKTRQGIQQVFLECIMQILDRPKLLAGAVPAGSAGVGRGGGLSAGTESEASGCC
jgi:Ras-related protein Rab-18